MGFLFGKGPDTSNQVQKLDHVQLQSSAYGQPIALVYGTIRAPGNLIWLDDFTPHEKSEHVGKGGGADVTSYTYTACIIIALCEGPIDSILGHWEDKKSFLGNLSEFTSTGARSTSTIWSHLSSAHSAKAMSYAGTAYVAGSEVDLPNGSLKNYSYHIKGLKAVYAFGPYSYSAGSTTAYDALPSDVVADILESADYGFGWPSTRINVSTGQDGTAASGFINYCHANSFYISVAINSQQPALDLITSLLEATNTAAVWSQGVLKFIPYGDTSQTANSHTFTPYLTAIYSLGADDFLPIDDGDPVTIERKSVQDTYNSYPVEYLDRLQDYKTTIAEDPDQADVEAFGLRRASTVSAHMICRVDYAMAISRIMAQRGCYQRNTFRFKLPQRYILLEPMDLVELTQPQLGLDAKTVRIIEIKEDEEGNFDCTAEDVLVGASTQTVYTSQGSDGSLVNYGSDPGNANTPVIFVPTLEMSGGELQLWMVTNGGTDWGGAEVWVSDDATTYAKAGIVTRGTYGTITSTITSGSTTIPVSLVSNSGALSSTTADGAADNLTAMWIGNEVFSYQTATLTGTNAYSLTLCLRGRESTTAAAHTNGDTVVRLGDGVFKYTIAYNRLGKTIYVKLVSFNTVGGGLQDISTLSPTTYAIPSAPTLLPSPVVSALTVQDTEF